MSFTTPKSMTDELCFADSTHSQWSAIVSFQLDAFCHKKNIQKGGIL